MILWTHVLEEYALRGHGWPAATDLPIPTPTAPNEPPAAVALTGIQLPAPGEALIKLNKRVHMKKFFERGQLRISPASSYLDPSLNHAIRDDELKFDRMRPRSEVTIRYLDEETSEMRDIDLTADVTKTDSLATDYYVCCMTHTLSYRLFEDFEADACVIIRDPKAFCSRLQEVVHAHLLGWLGWNRPVQYIDPYLHNERHIDLIFSKHFRHWYQQEYRFAWIPEKGGRTDLEPFDVELGSLKQISEIVCL